MAAQRIYDQGMDEQALQPSRPVPNTISFPRDLRHAIPEYGDRLLVFDRVSAVTNQSWAQRAGWPTGTARAQLSLLAHETGKLDGQFDIGLDLDAKTLRALGEFLIQVADQAEAEFGVRA